MMMQSQFLNDCICKIHGVSLLRVFPKRCINSTRRKLATSSYQIKTAHLKNEISASALVSALKPHICKPQAVVYGCYGGSPVLTKALLDGGVERLVVWDQSANHSDALKKLCRNYSGRLVYHQHQYQRFALSEAFEQDRHVTGLPPFTAKDPIEKHLWPPPGSVKWEDDPRLHLLIWMNESQLTRLISNLTANVNSTRPPFNWGRPSIYCAISQKNYEQLIARYDAAPAIANNLPIRSKLVELVFDTETLINSDGLFPVIKMTPRVDLFETVCAREEWKLFYEFIRMLHSNRHKRFISWAENLFPGFGENLIKMDFSMMQQNKHIHVSRIPTIFKMLKQIPQYHSLLIQYSKMKTQEYEDH